MSFSFYTVREEKKPPSSLIEQKEKGTFVLHGSMCIVASCKDFLSGFVLQLFSIEITIAAGKQIETGPILGGLKWNHIESTEHRYYVNVHVLF